MGEEYEEMVSPGASLSAAERTATKASAATDAEPRAKRTPGLWTVRATDTLFSIVGADGVKVLSTSWHSTIRNPYPLRAEALANAALAAAAPELLDALKAIAAVRKVGAPFADWQAAQMERIALDAISKSNPPSELMIDRRG